MKTQVFKLKNGLKVILVESRKSPVVSVQMWVRTGSADEKKGEEGISHFIEHLLFKGTRKFKTGEIASLVEGNGGELNAYTSYDQTVFYVTIETKKRHIALDVISDMMGFPSFEGEEIDNERGVVIEEIKRGEDSLGSVAWKTLFNTVYKKHSYRVPIIGHSKNIENLPHSKIKKFYQSRYVPTNMFLVVSGDFDPKTMKKEVEQYFSELRPFKFEKRKRVIEPKQTKPRVVVEKSKFKKAQAYIAWPVPASDHKDVPALDLLSIVLGTGDSSRLSKRLRLENLLTQSVGAFSYTPMDEGVFAVSMGGEAQNLVKAFQEALAVILEFVAAPPTAEELKKALAISASEGIYAMETVDGLSRKVGSDEFYFNNPEFYKKYLKAIYQVKPEQITKMARKYLSPEKISTVLLAEEVNDEMKKQISKTLAWYKSEFKKATKKIIPRVKFSVKTPQIKTTKNENLKTQVSVRPSGLTLVTRIQKDTPTFSLRAAVMGGVRYENPQLSGSIELLSRTWTAGSKGFSEEMINTITESVSAGLGAFGGRNTMGLTLDGLSPNQEELFPVFFDVLANPTFEKEKIDREKTVQLNQLKTKKDNPAQLCFQRFHELMFKTHPYSRDILGSPETLEAISTEALKGIHKELVCSRNLVLVAIGDFDQKKLEAYVSQLEKQISTGKAFKADLKAPEHRADEKGTIELQKEQTHIVLGYPGLTINSPERYTLDIIQSVLAGQGGRLFLELRDKNSLAYTVSPVRMEGIEAGYFGTYIGCSPEKAQKAVSMMREELKKLEKELISEEELSRAKNYLIGQHAISLQKKSSIAQAMLLDVCYGQSADHVFEVIENYKKITAENVRALAKKLFLNPEILVQVGPQLTKAKDERAAFQKET